MFWLIKTYMHELQLTEVASEARTSLYCRETAMILDCIDRTVALQII